MPTVGAYEAKTHLPKLLERVEQGEEITITRRGVPVARLISVQKSSKDEIKSAIEAIERLSQGCILGRMNIQEMRHEGHKF